MEVLRRNPDLLVEDVWRVFEVEGGGENSLAAYDKYSSAENRWRTALVELGNDGSLDRERLLDASLDALQRGFGAVSGAVVLRAPRGHASDTGRAHGAGVDLPLARREPDRTDCLDGAQGAHADREGEGLDPAEVVSQIRPALLTPARVRPRRRSDSWNEPSHPSPISGPEPQASSPKHSVMGALTCRRSRSKSSTRGSRRHPRILPLPFGHSPPAVIRRCAPRSTPGSELRTPLSRGRHSPHRRRGL